MISEKAEHFFPPKSQFPLSQGLDPLISKFKVGSLTVSCKPQDVSSLTEVWLIWNDANKYLTTASSQPIYCVFCPCFFLLAFKGNESKEVCQTGQWNFREEKKNLYSHVWKSCSGRASQTWHTRTSFHAENLEVTGKSKVRCKEHFCFLFPLPSDRVFDSIVQKLRGQLLHYITVIVGSNAAISETFACRKGAR